MYNNAILHIYVYIFMHIYIYTRYMHVKVNGILPSHKSVHFGEGKNKLVRQTMAYHLGRVLQKVASTGSLNYPIGNQTIQIYGIFE